MAETLSREQALAHPNVHVFDSHPIIRSMLDHLRDKDAPPRRVRRLVQKIGRLLLYEATRDIEIEPVRQTQSATGDPMTVHAIKGQVAVVPVLRSGFNQVNLSHELLPDARAWCYGLKRDEETLIADIYYDGIPKLIPADYQLVMILDPMLATGGSADDTCRVVKERRQNPDTLVKFEGLIAAPEGIARMVEHHPDIHIFTAAVDTHLDEKGFIRGPGAGDLGDRQMGTDSV